MNAVVIYQSHYGATETYAKWLAEDLGAALLAANQVNADDFQKYDTIVYGGGLYAGGVNGITLLRKHVESITGKAIYLFTVGIADVTDKENTAAIRAGLAKVLPVALGGVVHIYHLRGGMRYSKLSFLHRTMMKMMMNMVRKKPEHELRAEDKMMLETYGQDVDFTDRRSLAPLVADIRAGAICI